MALLRISFNFLPSVINASFAHLVVSALKMPGTILKLSQGDFHGLDSLVILVFSM